MRRWLRSTRPPSKLQQQVLADRLDRFEPRAVEPLGDALTRRARVRRLDLEALADKHLEPPRGAVERVSFGHAWK